MDPSIDRVHERLRRLTAHLVGPRKEEKSKIGGLHAVETCGIVAYVGVSQTAPQQPQDSKNAEKRIKSLRSSKASDGADACGFVLHGLRILQNRGYDSAGISTVDPSGRLITSKFASVGSTSDAIAKLEASAHRHVGHSIGVGHTRWATHGGVCDRNAHPHTDSENRISLVHNGIIENANELEEIVRSKGIKLRTETDTEIMAQLIGLEVSEGKSLLDAVRNVLPQLRGTWGLVIVDRKQPDRIVATTNGSPLLIGIGRNEMFVASEASAFAGRTKEFIALHDGEIAVVTATGHSLDDSRVETAHIETQLSSPAPFPHWTVREIYEQPEAVSRSLNYGGRLQSRSTVMLGGMDARRDQLRHIRHLVICACGTSYFAGLFGARLMRALRAFETVQVFDAAEFGAEDLPSAHGGMLVISQSGETKDVHRALLVAREHDIPMFSAVNVVRSMIARFTGCGVYLHAGVERGVASTKAFSCQVSVLAQLAVWFAQVHDRETSQRELIVDSLQRLSTSIGMVLRNTRSLAAKLAHQLQKAQHMFVLGKGLAEPVAREGALKIKEITYLHAEGYPGGSLKHGPFALIEKGTPVVLIVLRDRHEHFMWSTLAEVRSRGAFTILITECTPKGREQVADVMFRVPSNGPLTALLAAVPMQLFAYELSVLKGNNPDFPRNLAKTVTVD